MAGDAALPLWIHALADSGADVKNKKRTYGEVNSAFGWNADASVVDLEECNCTLTSKRFLMHCERFNII